MFVSSSMVKKVITIDRDASVFEAHEKMAAHSIRHLPVVNENGRLTGIVTDRDIRGAIPYTLLKEPEHAEQKEPDNAEQKELDNSGEQIKFAALKVEDIMTENLVTISPMHTIQDALLMIQKKKVGAFPVVDSEGNLTGIISVRDLLRSFINVLGIKEPGTLVGILVEQKIGQMKKIVDTITEENISIGSILVSRHWEPDQRAVFAYLLTNNVVRVKKKFKALGFTLLDPMEWYMDQLPQK